MANRFQKLFAQAKVLGLSKEELSAGASQWSGIESLRSLKPKQLVEYETKLQLEIDKIFAIRRQAVFEEYQAHSKQGDGQVQFIVDLIMTVFDGSLEKFRTWLKNYFQLDSERFLTVFQARKIILALQDMRRRGYSA